MELFGDLYSIGLGLLIGLISTLLADILLPPDWWVNKKKRWNRLVHGWRRSKAARAEYEIMLNTEQSIDPDAFSEWIGKKHNHMRIEALGGSRQRITDDRWSGVEIELTPQLDEEADVIDAVHLAVQYKGTDMKIMDQVIDTYSAGQEVVKLLIKEYKVNAEDAKATIRLMLGRKPETQYFLSELDLTSAKGTTKSGYQIRIEDNYIDFEGVIPKEARDEIARLSRLA